jgi:pimeloyl-ACP methyl ester carboxylesterase
MRIHRFFTQAAEILCLLVSLIACGSALPTSPQNVADPTSPPFPLTASPHSAATPPHEQVTAAPSTPTPLVYKEPFNVKVDVGGYKLSIKCVGTGSPTVVLDAGLNATGDTWIKVWPKLKTVTRACIYDRAGRGESERGPVPRTSQTIVTELHSLLLNAGIDGPYVLVGHSFGGFNVRLFASQYPDQVSGMVLVDTSHEDAFERILALLPPPASGECEVLAASRKRELDNPEGVDYFLSAEQVRQVQQTLGEMPLIVVSRGRTTQTPVGCEVPASVNQQIDQANQEMQAQLARLSSNSKHIIAEKSGHIL